jgi:hypothetical protein
VSGYARHVGAIFDAEGVRRTDLVLHDFGGLGLGALLRWSTIHSRQRAAVDGRAVDTVVPFRQRDRQSQGDRATIKGQPKNYRRDVALSLDAHNGYVTAPTSGDSTTGSSAGGCARVPIWREALVYFNHV